MANQAVITPPSATQSQVDYSNPKQVQPDLSMSSFLHKPNFFVVKDGASYTYYCISGVSKLYDSVTGKVAKVRLPVLKEGVLCLTGGRRVRVLVDDIVRGRVCKFREENQSDRTSESNSSSERAGKGSAENSGNGNGKAVQVDDDEGLGQSFGNEDGAAANLHLEEQVFALLYTKDAQALRRVKDTAHTRQLVEAGSVRVIDKDT